MSESQYINILAYIFGTKCLGALHLHLVSSDMTKKALVEHSNITQKHSEKHSKTIQKNIQTVFTLE